VDDIHLPHHPVHGHLDGERDRNAGIAVAAHVPAPDIALHLIEVLHLVRRPEEVEHLLRAGRVRDDLGDVFVVQALLERDQPPVLRDARHEGLAAVGLARVVEPGLAVRSGALLGRGAHHLLDVLGGRLARRQVIAVEGGAGGDSERGDWNDRKQGAHTRESYSCPRPKRRPANTWIHFRYRAATSHFSATRARAAAYSPLPGSGENDFWNLSGTPFQASASSGGVPLRVMLGHFPEKSAFSLSHFSALPSESGRIAAGGHSGSHTPQSMHSSGWITSMFSPS